MDDVKTFPAAPPALGDEYSEYEKERGKQMPSKQHSIVQSNLIYLLKSLYKTRYRVLSEITVRLGEHKYVPDIAVYARDASDWTKEEMEMTAPPLLAIEIESPSQSTGEMKDKADTYLAAGVRSVWLAFPPLATVMVMRLNAKAQFYSDGEVVDETLDIRVPVEEIFV
jgi:Uma2 family endonuclease